MKRAAAVAVGLTICLCVLLSAGCARYTHIVIASQRVEDYYCSMYEDDTVEIVRYLGEEARVMVPVRILDRTVVGMSTRSFLECATVEEALLPSTLTKLPPKLFDSCAKLRSVYIPATVEEIGNDFITDCPEFTTIYYGGSEEQWELIIKGSVLTDNYALSQAQMVYNYTPGQ